jgi:hypothetical protein
MYELVGFETTHYYFSLVGFIILPTPQTTGDKRNLRVMKRAFGLSAIHFAKGGDPLS